jgi:hypothetical protein
MKKKQQRSVYIKKHIGEGIEKAFPRLSGQKFKDVIESFLERALQNIETSK